MQFNDLSWQPLLASAAGAVASGVLSAISRWWTSKSKRKRNAQRMRRARATKAVASADPAKGV
jgi:hypothetical protein